MRVLRTMRRSGWRIGGPGRQQVLFDVGARRLNERAVEGGVDRGGDDGSLETFVKARCGIFEGVVGCCPSVGDHFETKLAGRSDAPGSDAGAASRPVAY